MMTEALTYYFDGEGRARMRDCLRHSIEWCAHAGVPKLVVFTGTGEGPHYAATQLVSREGYTHISIIAVTPPVGRAYRANPADPESPIIRAGIGMAMREELLALGVNVVAAHLPFKEVHDGRARTSEWTRVAEAYGVLGGGFALAVQAVLIACDAGEVVPGERVVVATADTSLVVRACPTEFFLSPTEGLLVEHIVCRPLRYDVSKPKHRTLATEGRNPDALDRGHVPLLSAPNTMPPESVAGAQAATRRVPPRTGKKRTTKKVKA